MSSEDPRRTLLVFADSLSYYGPQGGLPADDPRIWPNIVATQLGWDLELIGRIGWTCRDVWWAATQDPRSWAALPRAGAVVFATSGMDSLPSVLPTAPAGTGLTPSQRRERLTTLLGEMLAAAEYFVAGQPLKRLDTTDKLDGSKVYAIDVRLPGMLYAVIKHCPSFGGRGWRPRSQRTLRRKHLRMALLLCSLVPPTRRLAGCTSGWAFSRMRRPCRFWGSASWPRA